MGGMHNEDVPLGLNVIPILVAALCLFGFLMSSSTTRLYIADGSED